MFMFGTSTNLQVIPTITYRADQLILQQPKTWKLSPSVDQPVNITVSPNLPRNTKIVLQFSKDFPGGNCSLFVGYGILPNPADPKTWYARADTGTQSFGEIAIPSSSTSSPFPNPGSIMVLLRSLSPQSGIILQYDLRG